MGGIKHFLMQETAGLPNWGWMLVIVGGASFGFIFVKNRQNASNGSSTDATGSTVPQPSTDANTATGVTPTGLIVIPVQSPDNGQNTQNTQSTQSATPTVDTSNNSQTTTTQTPPRQRLSSTRQATVRAKGSLPQAAAYDAANNGVPVRATPGGLEIRKATFSSTVTLSGPSVQGGSNLPGNNSGSTSWYPLSNGGYINSEDLTNVQSTPSTPVDTSSSVPSINSSTQTQQQNINHPTVNTV